MNKDVYGQVGIAMTCRSFDEYINMMSLREEDLAKGPLLDVAAGASSFTASARIKGFNSTAVDPLYSFSYAQMKDHGRNEIELSTEQLYRIAHTFQWDYYKTIKEHRKNREKSLECFLADYALDSHKERYQIGKLPHLPFEEGRFSLILSSHFLFLYHEQFFYPFHLASILEMARVLRKGGEIRLYPLVALNREPYPYLNQLKQDLATYGLIIELLPTSFRFLDGANEVLKIKKI